LTSEDEALVKHIAQLLKVSAPCPQACGCRCLAVAELGMGRDVQVPAEHIREVVTTRQIVVRGNITTIPLKLADAHENKNAMVCAGPNAPRSFSYVSPPPLPVFGGPSDSRLPRP
jgi:hypothetical protein